MPNDIISFHHNWNGKFGCRCLTTIRPRNDYKYEVGRTYRLQLNEKEIGPAIIPGIIHFTLDQMTLAMALLDTGYELDPAKQIFLTMYKNRNFNWATQQFSFMLLDRGKDFKVTGITEKSTDTTPDLEALISEKAANYALHEGNFLSTLTISEGLSTGVIRTALTNAFNKGAAQAIELMNQ